MISFILVSNLTFPQSTMDWGDGELYIGTYYGEGIPDEDFRFYYRMFKVENSTVWDGGIYSSQQVGIDIDNSRDKGDSH